MIHPSLPDLSRPIAIESLVARNHSYEGAFAAVTFHPPLRLYTLILIVVSLWEYFSGIALQNLNCF
jgi:hypothetical protein